MFLFEKDFLFFILNLFLLFGFGGLTTAGFFQKYFNKNTTIHFGFVLLLGVGFAPMIVGTILYYAYLLLPNFSNSFYLITTYLVFVIFFLLSLKEIKELLQKLKNGIGCIARTYKIMFTIALLGCSLVFLGWSFYINKKQLTEHDTLEYAIQGKIFFEDASIDYKPLRIGDNGFYYVGLHGFSFPLQATNERLHNELFGVKNDILFRSLNSIFGLFILLGLCFYGYLKNGFIFSIFLFTAFLFSYGIFETLLKYHIDNFRIFYFLAALFLAYRHISAPSFNSLLITALFFGAQANSHTLGCLLAILGFGTLFLFDKTSLLNKLKNYAIGFIVFLFFGGLHYLLDVAYGTGWIFQDIKFY